MFINAVEKSRWILLHTHPFLRRDTVCSLITSENALIFTNNVGLCLLNMHIPIWNVDHLMHDGCKVSQHVSFILKQSGSWSLVSLNAFTGDNCWAFCSSVKNIKQSFINKRQWVKLADVPYLETPSAMYYSLNYVLNLLKEPVEQFV